MSTSANGTVVDKNGDPISGFTIVLDEVSSLFERELARIDKTTSGSFSLSYQGDAPGMTTVRKLRLRIRLGQHVVHEEERDDVVSGGLDLGSIALTNADEATSRLATLGTGLPSQLTDGNAIKWLVDNVEGWTRTAEVIEKSTSELYVMQLQLDVGPFAKLANEIEPKIVLRFNPLSMLNADGSIRQLTTLDARAEALLLDAADRGVVVRMQFPVPTVDVHGLAFVGVVLGLAAGLGLLLLAVGIVATLVAVVVGAFITGATLGFLGLGVLENYIAAPYEKKAKELAEFYFDAEADGDQNASNVSVRILKTQPYSVTHSKLVTDGQVAVLLGSPFEQVYFDDFTHVIDEPRRGDSASKGPIHDVSIGVRGPAVGHLQQVFNNHWNLAVPAEAHVPPAPPDVLPIPTEDQFPAKITTADTGEFLTSVQVVQTLNGGVFADKPKGEKGILESYLRAIHFAEHFVYIENQYFTNDAIGEALKAALKANSNLHVILVVNIEPDMPHYPHWQKALIQDIAKSIPDAEQRFGAFTTWSHSVSDPDHQKPRLRANYLHTKTAIIDNNWASVGSANLDGASLDVYQMLFYWRLPNAILQGGEMRNTETNCVVFEQTVPPGGSAVDALRRRLWAEHLGVVKNGALDLTHPFLDPPADNDWLRAFKNSAEAKQDQLKNPSAAVSPVHILPYPLDTFFTNPKRHLKALDIPYEQYDLVNDGPPSHTFTLAP
jgi:phosphatidylserine/phosphatidylglycerophosphate/cardiolipin synthase-like enzyme